MLSDNTAALHNLLDLKGSGAMLQIARELSWRTARGRWAYSVGHIPSEQHDIADSLSRLFAPDAKNLPAILKSSTPRTPFEPADFWKL